MSDLFQIKPFLKFDLYMLITFVLFRVYRICQALLMTCPLVQRERSVLALVHLECLAVRANRATQHSLRFPLTLPLISRASVDLHPPLSAHLLVPQHPALDPSLQQQCQVREQKNTIRVGR